MKFEELGVSENIIRALANDGITEPTAIQEIAIPLVLEGKDVIGMSRTGSGKTAAFGIPLLQRIKRGQGIQALILSPTRELAVQISKELRKWGDHHVATVFGGVGLGPQIDEMKRAQVVVATPGRMLDHLERRNVDFSGINCVVLDEADKMVDMGFIQDVERILNSTSGDRQVMLFGATISEEIRNLRDRYMKNPAVAKTELHVEDDLLEQYYYSLQPHEKFSVLVHLLKEEKPTQALVFCSARSTVDIVTRNLREQGISCERMHGKMVQNKRLAVIDRFNKGKATVLVASAVAARGLHIDGVSHVFNYDLSQDPQEYIHRVGRTARAGKTGKAITLLSNKDHGAFSDINRRYPVKITKLETPNFKPLRFNAQNRERSGFGGRGGSRFGSRGGSGRFGGGRGFSQGGRGQSRGYGKSGSRFDRHSEREERPSRGRGVHSKWDR